MDINKKILTDEQIKNLPLFFKVIYYNEMVSIEAENRLMKYNNNIHAVEMRHYNHNRKICLPYELTQYVKK